MTKEGHHKFTDALNRMAHAVGQLRTASDKCQEYKPFFEDANSVYRRMQDKWEEGVIKGREEGWFK